MHSNDKFGPNLPQKILTKSFHTASADTVEKLCFHCRLKNFSSIQEFYVERCGEMLSIPAMLFYAA